MSSLYVDKIDITHSTLFNSVYFSDKGEEALILAPIDYIVGGDGLAIKNSLSSPKALKGKKIAVEIGTDEHYLLYKSLNLYDLEFSDVELISKPSYEAHQLFIDGEVDGVFTYEPYLSMGADRGDGKVVFTTKDLPGHMIDALVTSKKMTESRKEDLRLIMNAWYKTLNYIEENPQQAFELMAKNEDMTASDFEAFYNSFTFYTEEEAKETLKSKETRDRLREMEVFAYDNLLINKNIEVDDLLKSPLLDD